MVALEDPESFTGFEAVLFDCDGTLADTHPAHYLALAATLAPFGLEIGREWYEGYTGTSTPETIKAALDGQGVRSDGELIGRLVAECGERYLDHLAAVTEITPVTALARQLTGRLPLAVASGGTRRTVEATLRHLGLDGLFTRVVTRDEVERGKPAPDVFLLAARQLGVEPAACVVLEDADSGLLAARRAGMAVVDVRGRSAAR
ncbi:HAD family phosphatase [Kitasatospora sp. NRRL B-11411]|uniref:HAD family hydrolase n=1 Tax=Kitasatospora sp. NRRL B-11411 TaxID=1463822 RepID=UPI00068C9D0B|nr:HAD family phosphatase [Kitasatospora sp. NRRL B-11411]